MRKVAVLPLTIERGETMAKMTIETLKQMVSDAFKGSETKETVEQAVKINLALDEIQSEMVSNQKNYNELLNNYKDVVLHSGFKGGAGQDAPANSFDGDEFIADWITENINKK